MAEDNFQMLLYIGISLVIVSLLIIFFTVIMELPSEMNTTTMEVTSQTYYQNILPSKQCAGHSIGGMIKARNQYSTGSMRPYIYRDDILLMIEYNPEVELVLGDVVDDTVTLHRIVAINEVEQRYQTKGDNNERKDSGWTNFNETKRVVCGVLRGTR